MLRLQRQVGCLDPRHTHDLHSMRTVGSTGSPLEAARKSTLRACGRASISGGTTCCGCFVIGDPTGEVSPGEIQMPALGADVDVVEEQAEPAEPQVRGELVLATYQHAEIAFLDDPEQAKYTAAYFERFPDVWAHGDFALWTEHDGIVILGRSDATLNAGGVRIGTRDLPPGGADRGSPGGDRDRSTNR